MVSQSSPRFKCDFCDTESPYPYCAYNADAFDAGFVTMNQKGEAKIASLLQSSGAWIACLACHDYIERDDYSGLLKYALGIIEEREIKAGNKPFSEAEKPVLSATTLHVLMEFRRLRKGAAIRFGPEDEGGGPGRII